MANPIFTWSPNLGVSQTVEPSTRVAKFGDGYEQRVKDGINNTPELWNLEFTGNQATLNPLRAFLKDRGGTERFDWTTPFGETFVFVCERWDTSGIEDGLYTVAAVFRQVYEA